jgi:hypothetical protein
MLVSWIAGIWASRLQALVEGSCAGEGVVIETGIDVSQERLSEAIQAIFRRKLHCTSESVRSFLLIADYLQVNPCSPTQFRP